MYLKPVFHPVANGMLGAGTDLPTFDSFSRAFFVLLLARRRSFRKCTPLFVL